MIFKPKQIPINFPVTEHLGREDYLASACNLSALAQIDAWPNWSHPVLVLHGPAGAGKTHLANIWRTKTVGADLAHTVDDFDLTVGDRDQEENLFHLYNRVVNGRGFLLLTAKRPPAMLNFVLPDLASRLRAAPLVGISAPDDALLGALVVKLFADRHLAIAPDVLAYVLPRLDRSFAAVRSFVAAVDAAALAEHRAITIPLVRHLLQGEQEDLFT